jgi:hypothetical protein
VLKKIKQWQVSTTFSPLARIQIMPSPRTSPLCVEISTFLSLINDASKSDAGSDASCEPLHKACQPFQLYTMIRFEKIQKCKKYQIRLLLQDETGNSFWVYVMYGEACKNLSDGYWTHYLQSEGVCGKMVRFFFKGAKYELGIVAIF